MEFDPEQMLLAINQGQNLDAQQLDALLDCLHQHREKPCLSADDLYSAVCVLLKLKNPGYLSLIEEYLQGDDPLLVAHCIDSLTFEWKRGIEFHEHLLQFIQGVPWDTEADLQISALQCTGFVLSEHSQNRERITRTLLAGCYEVFQDVTQDAYTRSAAYRALLKAKNYPKDEIPSEFTRLDLRQTSSDVNWELVEQIRLELGETVSKEAPLEEEAGALR